jgi:hypothetical protein
MDPSTAAPAPRVALAAAHLLSPLLALAVMVVAVAVAFDFGCTYSNARPGQIEPAAVPSDILFYPHVRYGSDDVYLVDGRFYAPGADGWVIFTRDPLELDLLRRCLEPEKSSWVALEDALSSH